MGITHTLTGHSERRTLYGESDKDVAVKTKNANDVNTRQLNAIRELCENWDNIVIAYEPVWAIGTGKTATPEIAQETHAEIRAWLTTNVSADAAAKTRILYGGSVTDANAAELIAMPDIDGFLVGGASLKPAFDVIVSACNNAK